MSASAEHCSSLALKLSQRLPLPFGVEKTPFLAELATALSKARDDEHATKIQRHCIENLKECPVPAEIIALVRELPEGDEIPGMEEWRGVIERECPQGLCDGSGWLITERDGISGAERCSCRPAPKAPEPVVAKTATTRGMRRVDPRMLAAGGQE